MFEINKLVLENTIKNFSIVEIISSCYISTNQEKIVIKSLYVSDKAAGTSCKQLIQYFENIFLETMPLYVFTVSLRR